MKISPAELMKLAGGLGTVVKDKEKCDNPYRDAQVSNVGLMGDIKNQDGTNKSLRKHVEPKGSQGHNTLRKDDAGLQANHGKKEKSKGEGHLQDNESMGGSSPEPKTATEAYLGAVFGMIKSAVGENYGQGGANALAPMPGTPLNSSQPPRLPKPGPQPPTPKN